MNIAMSEIFLSSVLGKTVINAQGHEIGRLRDLVMVPGDGFPEVSHLLVQNRGRILCVPWQRVALFNRFVVSVSGSLQSIPSYQHQGSEILLKRDILDRQIVDVNGAKVVRVNDLKLGSFHDRLCVFFVDVGFRGLLRRMGYEHLGERIASLFRQQLPHYHISWEYVQLLEMNLFRLTLTVARDQLKEIHPADLARIISDIPSGNIQAVLDGLDTETAGEAIHKLEPELRSRVISQMKSGQAASILEEMNPDQAADVLGDLPEEKAQELLGLMDEKEADEIQELMEHEEDTAGGLMNSQFVAVSGELSAGEALQVVRSRASEVDTIYYLYVLDKEGSLQGVASLKDLLVNAPEARINDLMTSGIKSVHVDSTPYQVLEIVAKYNLVAVPVLDREEKMTGIIAVDDILELFIPSALRRKRGRSS
jgi:CBS domain-containing protein/sporulation protein YlmC with PRC-barrel domain